MQERDTMNAELLRFLASNSNGERRGETVNPSSVEHKAAAGSEFGGDRRGHRVGEGRELFGRQAVREGHAVAEQPHQAVVVNERRRHHEHVEDLVRLQLQCEYKRTRLDLIRAEHSLILYRIYIIRI